ncbi:MAG TPA: hypothetical protein VFS32_12435 [Candidatus Limnocylindrales bacterium]|nr:hypothetical protein [Candidatus Limnocylindrales bacterium]
MAVVTDRLRGPLLERGVGGWSPNAAIGHRRLRLAEPDPAALGATIALVIAALALGWSLIATWAAVTTPIPAASLAVPGRIELELPGDTELAVFLAGTTADPWLAVVDPAGRPVPVRAATGDLPYPNVEALGRIVARFTTGVAGWYVVSADAWRSPGVMALGPDPTAAVETTLVTAALLCIVGAAITVACVVIVAVALGRSAPLRLAPAAAGTAAGHDLSQAGPSAVLSARSA